jgi:hypothetical protein
MRDQLDGARIAINPLVWAEIASFVSGFTMSIALRAAGA